MFWETLFIYHLDAWTISVWATVSYLAMIPTIVIDRRGQEPGIAVILFTVLCLAILACSGLIALLVRFGVMPTVESKLILFVILSVSMSVLSAAEARRVGRSTIRWLIGGALFTVFAVAALVVVPGENVEGDA